MRNRDDRIGDVRIMRVAGVLRLLRLASDHPGADPLSFSGASLSAQPPAISLRAVRRLVGPLVVDV